MVVFEANDNVFHITEVMGQELEVQKKDWIEKMVFVTVGTNRWEEVV